MEREDLRPLPDIIADRLKILFVGTNPGRRSSLIGHYFAGRGNAFWGLLYKSGLTDVLLTTEQDTLMLKYGYGLTDVVKRPSRSISGISRNDAVGARERLDKLLIAFSPKLVAFIGKTGYRYYLDDTNAKLRYGLQENEGHNNVFLLPSTSGASYADTKPAEKLEWFKLLRSTSLRLSQ